MNLTSTAALRVPPEMMTELALGMEDGVLVAQRYGFSAADFVVLMGQPWFTKALQIKREGLEKDGNIFRAKMSMLAEDLLMDLWAAAKTSESGGLKLDVAKLFTKLADLEPKNTQQVFAGNTGYQIVINIPDNYSGGADQGGSSSRPGDGGIREASKSSPVIDITPSKPRELPEGPKPFIVPDFDLTSDLTNYPASQDEGI